MTGSAPVAPPTARSRALKVDLVALSIICPRYGCTPYGSLESTERHPPRAPCAGTSLVAPPTARSRALKGRFAAVQARLGGRCTPYGSLESTESWTSIVFALALARACCTPYGSLESTERRAKRTSPRASRAVAPPTARSRALKAKNPLTKCARYAKLHPLRLAREH